MGYYLSRSQMMADYYKNNFLAENETYLFYFSMLIGNFYNFLTNTSRTGVGKLQPAGLYNEIRDIILRWHQNHYIFREKYFFRRLSYYYDLLPMYSTTCNVCDTTVS